LAVRYHRDLGDSAEFFLEVLPRKHNLTLLMNLDYGTATSLSPRVQDVADWKFLFYARYSGGALIDVAHLEQIDEAVDCVRAAFNEVDQ
jgi:hypothetical protein